MPAVLELIAEVLAIAPQVLDAGINAAALIRKARAALDSHAAPDDVDWQALDAQVNVLRARLNADPD